MEKRNVEVIGTIDSAKFFPMPFGITVLTIFLLTGSRGFFWDRYKLKTQFKTVAGLKSGSPVMVA